MNPKIIKAFPEAVVKGITGEGVFTGEANTAMLKGDTDADLWPWAQKMREASDNFKEAFQDETSLLAAMLEYQMAIGRAMKAAPPITCWPLPATARSFVWPAPMAPSWCADHSHSGRQPPRLR